MRSLTLRTSCERLVRLAADACFASRNQQCSRVTRRRGARPTREATFGLTEEQPARDPCPLTARPQGVPGSGSGVPVTGPGVASVRVLDRGATTRAPRCSSSRRCRWPNRQRRRAKTAGSLNVTRTTVSGAARLDGPCSMRCATRVATPRYRQAAQARRNRTSEHVVPNRARQPRGSSGGGGGGPRKLLDDGRADPGRSAGQRLVVNRWSMTTLSPIGAAVRAPRRPTDILQRNVLAPEGLVSKRRRLPRPRIGLAERSGMITPS
jgi:hypothetical protein